MNIAIILTPVLLSTCVQLKETDKTAVKPLPTSTYLYPEKSSHQTTTGKYLMKHHTPRVKTNSKEPHSFLYSQARNYRQRYRKRKQKTNSQRARDYSDSYYDDVQTPAPEDYYYSDYESDKKDVKPKPEEKPTEKVPDWKHNDKQHDKDSQKQNEKQKDPYWNQKPDKNHNSINNYYDSTNKPNIQPTFTERPGPKTLSGRFCRLIYNILKIPGQQFIRFRDYCGCYMGMDTNGNKYYENKRFLIGRARWVIYADYYKWDYEGSQRMNVIYSTEGFAETGLFGKLEVVKPACKTVHDDLKAQTFSKNNIVTLLCYASDVLPSSMTELNNFCVTPEWFGWLHYITDDVPCSNQVKTRIAKCHLRQRWILPPVENLSGTVKSFFPYSTTRQYVQVWDGKSHPEIPCRITVPPDPPASVDTPSPGPCPC